MEYIEEYEESLKDLTKNIDRAFKSCKDLP